MKKTLKNTSAASPFLLGLLFIISIALLLGTVGCAGNNGDTGQAPVDNGYLNQSESENVPAVTENFDQNNNENHENTDFEIADQNDYIEDLNIAEITVGEDGVIEIADPNFSLHMQEIQLNSNDFLGQTIRFVGMFLSTYWEGEPIYFVARLEGGCCGFYGFEVYLNEFSPFEDESWVEVTGILEEFYVEAFDNYALRLNVIELVEA